MSKRPPNIASCSNSCLPTIAIIIFMAFGFTCFNVQAQTYKSRDGITGIASYSTSWEGSYPTLVGDPILNNGSVHIYGYLINGYAGAPSNATLTGQATALIVEDTLRVFGDLFLYNNATIHIKPGGVLIVHGNYWQEANVNFNNEGKAVFLADWQSAESPLNISNTGSMYVAGIFTARGSSITPVPYSRLETDNPALYGFSRNKPVASVCAGNNSGNVDFAGPHLNIVEWQSSTDFFQNQITNIVNESASQPYANLTQTTSYRAYYKTSDGSLAYSDAATIVVRDFMDGSRHAGARVGFPLTGLISAYSLDGHAMDGSGNGNHGTILGGAVPVQDRFGLAGKAYAFDGLDDYIYTTTYFPNSGPQLFSVSIWFKTTTTTGGRLIGFGDKQIIESDKRDRHLYMANNGQLFFGIFPNNTPSVISTTESYNDGKWHHVVVSLSSDGTSLIVDGELKASNANMTAAQKYPGYWKIGFDWLYTWPSEPASRYFKGSLDDIYIFDKALSPEETELLYQTGQAATPLCDGEVLQLMAATKNGASYVWSGPAGFSSTEQNPLIEGVSTANAGQYTVAISFEGCTSSGTINVAVNAQGGSLSGDASVCFADNSGSIHLSGYVGDIVRWERSTDGFQTFEPIALTTAELRYHDLTSTTAYRAVVKGRGACPEEVYSSEAKITVKPPVVEGTNAVFTEEFPSDGLMGAYSFNGNAWDVSGKENHGSIIGAIAVPDRFGVEGSAYAFDGIDDKIYTATQYPSPGPQVFSISLWFNTTSTTGGRLIGYSKSQADWSGNFDRHIYMDDLGHLYFGVFNEGDYGTVQTAQSYNDGQWHQLTASLSAEGLKLYVDGQLMDSNPHSTTGEAFSGFWRLGGDSMGGGWPGELTHPYFEGVLDDIFIYERALSQEEVSQSFTAGEEWVCEGEELALAAPTVTGATYACSGPNNFISAEQNISITNVSLAAAGTYTLTITVDGCQAQLFKHVKIVPAAIGGTLTTASEQFCIENNNGLITLSGHTGTIVRWESSTDNFATDTTQINHTTSGYSFTDLVQTTTFRAVVSNGSGLCTNAYSSPLTIIIDSLPVGGMATASADSLCAGYNSGTVRLNGYIGDIVRWESSTDDFTSVIDTIAHTTPELLFQNLMETTAFRAVVKNGLCGEEMSIAVVVSVDAATIGGVLSGGTEVCGGSNMGTLSLEGHIGEVLAWESAPDAEFSDITTIAQSSSGNTLVSKLLYENLTTTTFYRAVVKNGACTTAYSSIAEVTVSTIQGGELAASQSVCQGSNSGNIALSGFSGSIIRWESSTDSFVTDVTHINNVEAAYAFENLQETTSYRAVIGNGGICAEVYSTLSIIYVQPLPVAGEVEGSATVCAGENTGTVELSGFQGPILRWERSIDNFKDHIEIIPATTVKIAYQDISQTTSYRAVVGNEYCGEFFAAEATVVVIGAPLGGVINGGRRILAGTNSGTLLLEGFQGEVLQWEVSSDQFNTDIRPLNYTQEQLSYENLDTTSWYRVLVGSQSCSPVYSQPAGLIINKAPLAVADNFVVPFGQPFNSQTSLLENDSDPEGDLLRIKAQTNELTAAGNKVIITADGYFTYEVAAGFSGADSFIYHLCDSAGDASGCTSGTVLLQVEEEEEPVDRKIIIYQGFSPNNGDNKNNTWIIKNIEYYPDNLVQVYNRYGTLVFEVKGYNNTNKVFDGFSNRGAGFGGKELPQDTYYYQVRLDEGSAALTGFVLINR